MKRLYLSFVFLGAMACGSEGPAGTGGGNGADPQHMGGKPRADAGADASTNDGGSDAATDPDAEGTPPDAAGSTADAGEPAPDASSTAHPFSGTWIVDDRGVERCTPSGEPQFLGEPQTWDVTLLDGLFTVSSDGAMYSALTGRDAGDAGIQLAGEGTTRTPSRVEITIQVAPNGRAFTGMSTQTYQVGYPCKIVRTLSGERP